MILELSYLHNYDFLFARLGPSVSFILLEESWKKPGKHQKSPKKRQKSRKSATNRQKNCGKSPENTKNSQKNVKNGRKFGDIR